MPQTCSSLASVHSLFVLLVMARMGRTDVRECAGVASCYPTLADMADLQDSRHVDH